MFNQLPHEMNREIGSFLDYESRMNFAQVVIDKEDRFVRKLNSDAHNLRVKVDLVKHKLHKFEETSPNTKSRLIAMKKLFLYLLHTKDTALFDLTGTGFHNVVKDRASLHTNMDTYYHMGLTKYTRETKSLMRVSAQLASLMDTKKPSVVPIKSGFVAIA